MPGASMIGESRAGSAGACCLPPWPRSVCRILRSLKDAPLAAKVLLDGLDGGNFEFNHADHVKGGQRRRLELLQNSMRKIVGEMLPSLHHQHTDRKAEERMSLALLHSVETAFDQAKTSDVPGATAISDNSSNSSNSSEGEDEESSPASNKSQALNVTLTLEERVERELWIRDTMAVVLESLHLQVTARTIKTWGQRKIYQIYQLNAPCPLWDNLEHLRTRLQTEFQSIYHGGGQDESDCRVHALSLDPPKQPSSNKDSENDNENSYPSNTDTTQFLYIQLNIGKLLDLHDESLRSSTSGEKKKKKGKEFVAVLQPGSCLVALTASKDPWELLRTAVATQDRLAVGGRFAQYADSSSSAMVMADPLAELHSVSTGALVGRQAEHNRLEIGRQHGRSMAALSNGIKGNSSVIAANKAGVMIDHSSSQQAARKRSREQNLGNTDNNNKHGRTPNMQRFCWKWTGYTSATSACWNKNDDNDDANNTDNDVEKTKFKCAVILEGPDVFGGLADLMDDGLVQAPLPNFVRDAPTLSGGYTTINIDPHGQYGAGGTSCTGV
eukprot:scaffold15802_cov54-Attheya_sp.AAC.1